jgi:hypothetical protein
VGDSGGVVWLAHEQAPKPVPPGKHEATDALPSLHTHATVAPALQLTPFGVSSAEEPSLPQPIPINTENAMTQPERSSFALMNCSAFWPFTSARIAA